MVAGRREVGVGGDSGGGGGDDKFETITSFFLSKKGTSFTVFLKPEHIEQLTTLEAGDMLGITPNKTRDDMFGMWVIRGAGEERGGR